MPFRMPFNEVEDLPNIKLRSIVPFKPILDRVLVREILLENKIGQFDRSEHYGRESDRGTVVAIGDGVAIGGVLLPIPVAVGDVVIMGEYGRERLYLNPEDEFDKTLPKYFLIRCADLKGKALA
jgi:chaperonin GroES